MTPKRQPRQTKQVRLKKRMDGALIELARAELVRTLNDAEPAYLFKHALVQDTAQASLLNHDRKRLHRQVAGAYEKIYADRCMDEFAALLTQHYAEAGDDAKTLAYGMHAGDVAASAYANVEAVAFYTQALDAAKRAGATTGQFIHLYTKRGRVYEVAGNFDQALSDYDEMAAFAQTRRDRKLELASLVLRATLRCGPMHTFDPALGQQLADQALALAQALNDRAAKTKILWNLELLALHIGQPERAIEYGEQALSIARELNANGHDMREQIAYILNDLTTPYLLVRGTADGIEANAQARALWRALDNKPMLVDNLGIYSQFLYSRGEFAQAIELGTEAAAIASNIGNTFGAMFNKSYVAGSYAELGEFDAAWREGNEAVALGKNLGGIIQVVGPANLALLAALLGAFLTSQEFDGGARAGFVEHMPAFFRSIAYAILARAAVLRGDLAQAADDIAASHAERASHMQVAAWAQVAIAEARLALAHNAPADVLAVAGPHIKIQQDTGFRWMLAELLYLQGLASHKLDKMADAFESLAQARAVAEPIYQRRILWQIYAALSELEIERGNAQQANAYQEQARQVIEYIVEHTPQEFRAGFLNLPRVREILS